MGYLHLQHQSFVIKAFLFLLIGQHLKKMPPMVQIVFRVANLTDMDIFSKSDPFLILSRPARIGSGNSLYTRVRKTETINNNLNPEWKVLYVSLSELCDSDYDMKLKVEVHDDDGKSSEVIGECELSLQEMMNMAEQRHHTNLTKQGKQDTRGELFVTKCLVQT